MGWFKFGKAKQEQVLEIAQGCMHPISQQVNLYEEPGEPRKLTALRCGQCGDRLPLPQGKK